MRGFVRGLDLGRGSLKFPAGRLSAEVQRQCQFRQFRGLKLKPPVPQPCPRSVDSGSDSRQKNGGQKHDRYDQQGRAAVRQNEGESEAHAAAKTTPTPKAANWRER